jgi:hypothetical protein
MPHRQIMQPISPSQNFSCLSFHNTSPNHMDVEFP